MKNKKVIYFLIVALVFVWGLIIYKIVHAAGDDSDPLPQVSAATPKEAYNDYASEPDTEKLLLNYRDPFGIVPFKDTTKVPKPITHKTVPLPVQPTMNWSFIGYTGYIVNPTTRKIVTLVTINGQSLAMSEGDTREKVRLLKNFRDSIKISYEGKTKFITLKPATQ